MNKPKSRAVYMADLRKKQKSIYDRGLDLMSIYPTPEFIKPKPVMFEVLDEETGKTVKLKGITFGSYSVVTDRLYDEVTSKDIGESALKLINYIQRNVGNGEALAYNTNIIVLSIESIMKACNLSKPTAYRALTKVIDLHVLYKTELKNKYVVNHRYIYRFSPMKFIKAQTRYNMDFDITVENNMIIVKNKEREYGLEETCGI